MRRLSEGISSKRNYQPSETVLDDVVIELDTTSSRMVVPSVAWISAVLAVISPSIVLSPVASVSNVLAIISVSAVPLARVDDLPMEVVR